MATGGDGGSASVNEEHVETSDEIMESHKNEDDDK
jgi:hypothetical protein